MSAYFSIGAIIASSVGIGFCSALAMVWFMEREPRMGWRQVWFAIGNAVFLVANIAFLVQRMPR